MRRTEISVATPDRRDEACAPRARASRWSAGETVYDRLREVAGRVHGDEGMLTVGATGLLHEAILRAPGDIRDDPEAREEGVRRQMVRVVIDRARHRNAQCRAGSAYMERGTCLERLPAPGSEGQAIEDLGLRIAVERLASVSPYLREVFRLKYELDLANDDAAAVLEISERTLRRDLLKVRGLLGHFLSSGSDRPPLD